MEEVWRKSELENYDVSNEGRIKNSKTGRIMKTNVNKRGYEQISLKDGARRTTMTIHKLVAEAFHPGDHEGCGVIHKDHNKLNNRADNLEWKTNSEIALQTYKDGRKQSHRMRRTRCVETGKEYESQIECARDMGVPRETVSKSCNNPAVKTKDGYHFEFID